MSEGSKCEVCAAVQERVAQLGADATALEAALGKARLVSRLLLVGAVVLVVFIIWQFKGLVEGMATKEYQAELMDQITKSYNLNQDDYNDAFQDLWEGVQPKLKEAFESQIKKDLPLFKSAVLAERDTLRTNLRTSLDTKLKDHYKELLKQHEGVIALEFPEVNDKKMHARMVANMGTAMEQLVKKYYMDDFRDQLTALYTLWDEFDVAETPDEGDPALEDQLYGQFWELLSMKIRGTATADIAGQ